MTAVDITKHIRRKFDIYRPRVVIVIPLAIRQSVIANLLTRNNDLRIAQSFTGHIYPSVTERYRQGNVKAPQATLQIYHPFS